MFGVKINEFDNSDGTIESFNNIFPKTLLENSYGNYVEIGNIVENEKTKISNPFIRHIKFYNKNWKFLNEIELNFGQNNFLNASDMIAEGNIRFKYIAIDLNGDFLAKGYNRKEIASKIGCGTDVINDRLKKPYSPFSKSPHKFNIKRIEI